MTPLIGQTLPPDAGAGAGFVVAAYIVFLVLLAIYVGIMAVRLNRVSDEIEALAARAERREDRAGDQREAPREPVATKADTEEAEG